MRKVNKETIHLSNLMKVQLKQEHSNKNLVTEEIKKYLNEFE